MCLHDLRSGSQLRGAPLSSGRTPLRLPSARRCARPVPASSSQAPAEQPASLSRRTALAGAAAASTALSFRSPPARTSACRARPAHWHRPPAPAQLPSLPLLGTGIAMVEILLDDSGRGSFSAHGWDPDTLACARRAARAGPSPWLPQHPTGSRCAPTHPRTAVSAALPFTPSPLHRRSGTTCDGAACPTVSAPELGWSTRGSAVCEQAGRRRLGGCDKHNVHMIRSDQLARAPQICASRV